MILLDTNVLIHCLKGRQPLSARVLATDRREIAIPAVALFELEYGSLSAISSKRRTMLNILMASMQEAPFDREAALEAARIRVDLEKRGLAIGALDAMIAGTAVSQGAVLVTNNTKEFGRVKGLRMEDWTVA